VRETPPGPGWKTFVPAGALPTVETVQKVDALRTATGPIEIFLALGGGWSSTFWALGVQNHIYLYNLYIIIYIIICKIMIYIKSYLAKSSKL
jgi:type IV secretory pathway VirB6-like protein